VVQTRSAPSGQRNATNGPRCPGCLERDELIAQLRKVLKQIQSQFQALRERSGRHAGNSSMPPSSNPPDAPKLKSRKKPSGRKRGGQPGHPPANRDMVPAEQLAEPPIACIPDTCAHCAAALSGVDPLPLRHQVTELPPIIPEVREYQRHLLRCPHCGEATRGQLPDGVPESAFGPRLQALIDAAEKVCRRMTSAGRAACIFLWLVDKNCRYVSPHGPFARRFAFFLLVYPAVSNTARTFPGLRGGSKTCINLSFRRRAIRFMFTTNAVRTPCRSTRF